jgi:CzcA family heavy metal efflux pump
MNEQGKLMRWIVASSLRFRWLVLFAGAALIVIGIGESRKASVDVYPEFAPPRVQVQTIALGNSSQQVEELITIPLEEQLNGIQGLEDMRSTSVSDLSSIELIFERGTDIYHARQVVQERLTAATPTLPTWAAPPQIMPLLSSNSRTMEIGLSSDKLSLIEMSKISYWEIRERLLRVPGVADVNIWGEHIPQEHVRVDPKKLAQNDISLQQVMDATAGSLDSGLLKYVDGTLVGTGGFVNTSGQRLDVRNVQSIATAKDLAQVPIERRNGKEVRLADVGNVVGGHQPLSGEAVINDGPGLMLIVQKFPNANTVEVTRGVEEAIDQMRPGLPGMHIDTTIFRPATFIEMAIHNLTTALFLGVMLVILILAAFLFEWRTAFISMIAIPLSVIGAVIVLMMRDTTINTMLLAGLIVSVGVVVDDAIIDVENIVRRLRQGRAEGSDRSTFSIVLEASVEVRTAIAYATLINVVAVVPVFFLGGLSGAFFKPLVFSYGLAVLVSMLVALTVTPALCLILLSRGHRHQESPLLRVLKRGYGTILSRVIRTPWPAISTAAVVMLAGAVVAPTLGQSLFPNFKERDFLMHWMTKPGTSAAEEVRMSVRACKDLRQIPGVRNCGTHIGQAVLGEEVHGVDFGENWISISPKVDYDKTVAAIRKTVDSYPGLYHDVQTYLRESVKESLTGATESIVVRITGPDLNVLRSKANEVTGKIKGIDGVIEAHPSFQESVPHIAVKVNLPEAERYGITAGDVRRQAATLVASEEVGDIFRGGKAYDVHVWSTPETRDSVSKVRELPIYTPGGKQIRLEQVADVRTAPTPNVIERDQQTNRIDVGANVAEGQDLGSVVKQVKARIAGVKYPHGYSYEVLGESTELASAQKNLLIYGIAAAFAIFALLLASFASLRLALVLFLTLPMALVGGALAVWMGGGILSLGSLVGFLTVFGIAARNGILMISHFQHLESEEGEQFGPALVLRGAKERLAPILMTALATALALVPLAVAGQIPGNEIQHPMAIVILGGLITSTLLTLFVLPSLYLRFGKSKRAQVVRAQEV